MIQSTLKIPCTAEGKRHAHVLSIMPVPYVIPDAMRPPTYPIRYGCQKSPSHSSPPIVLARTYRSCRTYIPLVSTAFIRNRKRTKVHLQSQPPRPPPMRQALRQPRRPCDSRRPIPNTNHDPRDGEHCNVLRGGLQHDGHDGHDGGDGHGVLAAERVRHSAVEEAREHLADVHGGRVERRRRRCQVEVVFVGGQDVEPAHHRPVVAQRRRRDARAEYEQGDDEPR